MKKVISVFVLAVMAALVLFAVAGCSGNSETQQNSDNSALQAELEELKDRVEDLENKNNVFWTDKAEYAEDETMTVYFKDTAVFKIKLDFDNAYNDAAFWVSGKFINYHVKINSLVSDIYAGVIINTAYMTWEGGNCLYNIEDNNTEICYKNIETATGGNFTSEAAVAHKGQYDFVICVPGTSFELARFVNVTVHKSI